MGEEFQESEVIFPENAETIYTNDFNFPANSNFQSFQNSKSKRINNNKKNKKQINSLPLNVPQNFSEDSWFRSVESDYFEDKDEGEELVPPHVIVGRRIAGKMAFSVCSGNGRTLKGRDLSQVRNSILRMTGFLET